MEQWALVTGAASGIGFEFAKLLRQDGYNLLLVDNNEYGLEVVSKELQAQNKIQVKWLPLDLSGEQSASRVYQWVSEFGISPDVLINNAGFGLFGYFSDTLWERELKMIYLHIHTPTLLIKMFLPGMLHRKSGKILNVTSLAAFHPGPFMCMYYSTKSYLLSLSTSLAAELKNSGVSVTALCPGITRTGFQQVVGAEEPKIKAGIAEAADVARCGYQAMMAGKLIAVPGISNKLILLLRRFLSTRFVADQVRALQIKNRKSTFEQQTSRFSS